MLCLLERKSGENSLVACAFMDFSGYDSQHSCPLVGDPPTFSLNIFD